MQIHEITIKQLDEGLMDLAKGAAGAVGRGVSAVKSAGSAVANPFSAIKGAYTDARDAGAAAASVKAVADKATNVWLKYANELKAANPDPARYATLYRQSLAAFVQKNLLKGQSINSAINKLEINQLIDAISDAEAKPQQVAQLFPKLVQQSALSSQDVAQPTLVKIVSTSPPVIQYRGANYALNQGGDWANQTTSKVPDESFQAFLDSEARKAGVSL
jgi:hypothetical protein